MDSKRLVEVEKIDCSKQLVELTELEVLNCDGGVNGWYIALGALGVIGGLLERAQ